MRGTPGLRELLHRSRCLTLPLSLCGLIFYFSSEVKGADETAASATPAPTAKPAVLGVGIHPRGEKELRPPIQTATYAQRGDDIWIDVVNFAAWVAELRKNKKLPDKHEIRDLVLYLDHIQLSGVSPIYWYEWPNSKYQEVDGKQTEVEKNQVTTVAFTLIRNDKSKAAWSHILSQPVLNRQVVVSVGFENGEELESYLSPDSKERPKQFWLTVIPNLRTAFGLVIILGALLAFLSLARHTHIIRDTMAPRRPDGLRPYSLARAQMAFWFFLVISSYFFLWLVTGDMDTLNTSVLGLIGISAGTALGSAFVDAGKPIAGGTSNVPTVDVTKPHLEVVEELAKLRSETLRELESLQKARALIASTDKQQLAENERQLDEVRERLANYGWQTAYFAWPTWKGVMYDLLAENNLISFHRFQIFVWTLVLGVMFVANVYSELAMPQFSATLLGLLGISAGTYVGFKLPEPKPQ
jgi:hypothetical protein